MASTDENWVINVDLSGVANDLNKFTGQINSGGQSQGGRNPSISTGFIKRPSIHNRINRNINNAVSFIPMARTARIGRTLRDYTPPPVRPPRPMPPPPTINLPYDSTPRTLETPGMSQRDWENLKRGFQPPDWLRSPFPPGTTDVISRPIPRISPGTRENNMMTNQLFDKALNAPMRLD